MDTPERIWLIKIDEDEMIWANEPYPDGDEADEDIAEYRLASTAQAEIDALVNALDDAINHGLWDTYDEMLASYKNGQALIAKHKGVCPSCNIDGFNNRICGNCGYGIKPKYKWE